MENQASTSNQALDTRAAEPSQAKHLIFLSHSGQQKPFVAKLDRALRNVGHNPFFDTHSLPLGEPFPPHILQNAQTCKLGVVVLSPAFLTSYWPMLELNVMSTPPSVCTILPLFFEIQPNDIKRRFSEWQEAWHKIEELHPSRVNISEWKEATARLSILNGIVYNSQLGEDFFVQEVVRRICTIAHPPLRYDISHLIGDERLTQVIASLFEKVHTCVRARAIGFHAIGGQGKTTICKLMVNHYTYDYAGKCGLIEFPSFDCNEEQIVEQCKRALRQLTSMSTDRIDMIHSFDECMQQLKARLVNRNVFIAIDNIWEKSLEYAQRILEVGFTIGSKILVTSRSKKVLSNLLGDGSLVMPLPSLNKEEARQVFIKPFNRNQAGQLTHMELRDSDVDDMTQRYQFDNGYHILAIHALGVSLGRTGLESWPQAQKHDSPFIKDGDDKVNEVIRMNFETIPEMRRDLFLDVIVIYLPYVRHLHFCDEGVYFFPFQGPSLFPRKRKSGNELWLPLWLNSLHGDKMNGAEIKKNLRQLEYDGLLEFDHEFTNVSVHELYKNLAIHEAIASGRFVLPMKDLPMQAKDIKWASVDRVVWSANESLHNWSSEPVPRGMHLPKLRLLMIDLGWKIFQADNLLGSCRLEYMPGLRVLDVDYGIMRTSIWSRLIGRPSWVSRSRYPSNISWLRLTSDTHLKQSISGLSHQLCVLQLSEMTINGSLCLNGLVNLQIFSLTHASVKEISGLGGLVNLKHMCVHRVPTLLKIGTFSRLCTELQVLEIDGCFEMSKIEGLCDVPYLRKLKLYQYPDLGNESLPQSLHALYLQSSMQTQPNLSGMMTIKHILLIFEEVTVAAVGIEGLPNLKTLELRGNIAAISSISQLPRLKLLIFQLCSELRELDLSSLIDLPSLERLKFIDCPDLENVVGEPHCSIQKLKQLSIQGCQSLNGWMVRLCFFDVLLRNFGIGDSSEEELFFL